MKTFKKRAAAMLVVLCMLASIIPAPASFAKAVDVGSVSFALRDYASGRVAVKTEVATALSVKDAGDAEVDLADVDVSYTVEPADAAEVDAATGVISTLKEGAATVTVTVTPKEGGGEPETASLTLDIQKSSENLFAAGDFENADFTGSSRIFNRVSSNWRKLTAETIERAGNAENKAMRIFMDSTQIGESTAAATVGGVSVPQAGNIFLRSGIPAYPGRLYEMSFWIKTADFVRASDITLGIDMYYSVNQTAFTGSNNISGVTRSYSVSKSDKEWQKVTLWVAAPVTSTAERVYITPYFTVRANANETGIGGTVYIDDLEIREVGFDKLDVQMGAVNEEKDGTTTVIIQPLTTTGEKIGIRQADLAAAYKAESTNSNVIDVSATVSGLTGQAGGRLPATGKITTKGYGDTTVTISCTLNGVTREWSRDISIKEKLQIPASATLKLSDYESRIAVKTKVNTALTVLDAEGAEISKSKYNVSYTVEPESAATVDGETGVIYGLEKGNAKITATVTDVNGENPKSTSIDVEIAESSENLFAAGDFENADLSSSKTSPFNRVSSNWRKISAETIERDGDADNKAMRLFMDGEQISESGYAGTVEGQSIPQAGNMFLRSGVPAYPGRLYEMSFWIKTADFTSQNINASVDMYYSTSQTAFSSGTVISGVNRNYAISLTDADWQKVTLWVAAPVTATVEQIYLSPYITLRAKEFGTNNPRNELGIGGTIYIDDIEIREVGFDKINYTLGAPAEAYQGETEVTLQPVTTTGEEIGIRSDDLASVYTAESSNPKVIDASALVSGLTGNKNGLGAAAGKVVTTGIGVANVIVTCVLNGETREVAIPVDMTHIPNSIHEAILSYEKTELILGDKLTPTLSVKMLDGTDADLTGAEIKYTTSNPNIIAINEKSGMIAATGEGSATITATVTAGDVTISGSFVITSIDPGELESVALEAPKTAIARGEKMQLGVSGKTSTGNSVSGENLDVSYAVVEGTQYASVDAATGVVTGVEAGDVTVEATATLRGGQAKTARVSFKVNDSVDHSIAYEFGNAALDYSYRIPEWQADNWSTNAECTASILNVITFQKEYGLQVTSTTPGQWVTFRIQVDREGWYTPSLTVWGNRNGGIFRSYIAKPAAAAGEITDAQLEELRSDEYSIGVINCDNGAGSQLNYATVKMRTVYFPAPGEYAFTIEVESKGALSGRMLPKMLSLERVAFAEATAREALPEMDLASIIPAGKRWMRVGSSASYAMMPTMADGAYEDLIAAESVEVQSSDDTKLKAEITTDTNGYRTLTLTGLEKAADTTVTLTVKINGATYTEEIPVPVTVGQTFDFKNYNGTGDDTKTPADAEIGVDGWQVSSDAALSYNGESGIVADTSAIGQDVSFKVDLEEADWYQLTLSGGKLPDGGIAGVYIDGYYVGEYDFSGDGVAAGDGELMRALNLTAGEHTVTLRTTGTSGDGYKLYIGALDFIVLTEEPTLTKIIATTDSDDIPVGSSAGIRVVGIWSDGAEQALLPKLDGSADDTYTLAVTSSDTDVASVENCVWYAHKIGESNIQIRVTTTTGGKEIVLPVAVNEKAWVPDTTEIVLEPEKLYEEATVTAHIKTLLGDGSKIDESALTVSYTSGDESVFTVNGNVLTGVKKGEAILYATVSYSGGEKQVQMPVTVLPKGFAEVIVTADDAYVNTGVEVQLTVTAKTNTGEAQDLTGAAYVYESLTPDIASVSQDGVVTTLAEGNAKIRVTVTVGDITNSGEIDIGVTDGKTQRSYYTDEKIANARENIAKYTWARDQRDAAVKAADKYIGLEEELWALVPGEGLPRSWIIGYTNDPMGYTCPHPDCGVNLRAAYSTYPWITDPLNNPWKIQCPACRRRFPSNDFGAYYKSGLNEHGVFDPALADRSLLVNELYPELGEGWGVDDGFGWKTGNVNSGIEECKTFIAYYIGRGLWVNGEIENALLNLRNAYLYTGDIKYGRVGAILIDRIADLYPDYKLIQFGTNWWNSHGGNAEGKLGGRIEDHAVSKDFIYAYDAFFPAMEDAYVIDFLSKKAEQYKLENKKTDAWSIRRNSEDGILREVFEAAKRADIYGNFGMHQSSVALAAVVLDCMPETGEWIDWIMQPGVYTKPVIDPVTKLPTKIGSVTGGDVEPHLIDKVFRDGSYSEAAPQYNKTDLTYYCLLINVLNGYEKYKGANLYEHPSTMAWFSSFAPLLLVSNTTAQIGDSARTANIQFVIEASGTRIAFENTGDPRLAQYLYACWKAQGTDINTVHSDIFTKDPEKVKDDILKVIDEYGELDQGSEMMNGMGFSILRDGKYYDASVSANTINTQRDFWMYYGTTRGVASHGHADILNLGIEAYGLNMAPDLGYPEATGNSPHRMQWTRNTLSHNTVVVNEENQGRNDTLTNGTPLHFDDVGRVKLMDVDAGHAYPDSTDIYRRTVVMIQASDEVSYGLDFFRVKGGNDHIYSFHSQSDTVSSYSGVDFTEQKQPVVTDSGEVENRWAGSYAGVDVPFGADANDPSNTNIHKKRGYTWLEKIRKDTKVEGKFNIDFKVTDFRKVLPYEMDLHMNVTMLNTDINEVTLGLSTPPQVDNNPEHLEYLLARRSGTNLDTLFTTAFEPYNGERYLSDIDAATEVETADMPFVEISDGTEGADDKVQLVRVTFKDGRVDYVIYATNNQVKYTVYEVEQGEEGLEKIPLFDFRGFVGVYTVADGRNTFSYVNDGDLIAGYETTAAYTGSVVDFTKDISFDNSITVRFDVGQAVTPEELVGRNIYIENDGFQNGVYLIEGATKSGRNIILDIGTDRLIRKYQDANDMSKGYVYNIEAGQTFRVPLSLVNDTAPVFDAVGEQSATAGKKYSLKVNATSPVGAGLIYSANTMPRGASFDAATATISWTPDSTQIGTHNFAIDVTDGGSVSTLRFEIEVYRGTGSATADSNQSNSANGEAGSGAGSTGGGGSGSADTGSGGGGGASGGGASGGGGSSSGGDTTTGDTGSTGDNTGSANAGDGTTDAPSERFIDLGNHTWAKDAIYALVDAGVVNGTSANTYSPAANIKRADFAIMLVRAFGITEGEGENFVDVDANKYYAEELRLAKANGIVNGVGENRFNPEGEITRQDMMLMLARALDAAGYELSEADASVLAQFADAAEISEYAKDAVARLIAAQAVAGANGRINPTGKATRAEVAVLLGRIFAEK